MLHLLEISLLVFSSKKKRSQQKMPEEFVENLHPLRITQDGTMTSKRSVGGKVKFMHDKLSLCIWRIADLIIWESTWKIIAADCHICFIWSLRPGHLTIDIMKSDISPLSHWSMMILFFTCSWDIKNHTWDPLLLHGYSYHHGITPW